MAEETTASVEAEVSVEEVVEAADEPSQEYLPYVDLLWELQGQYQRQLVELFNRVVEEEGVELNPDEREDYARAILEQDGQALKELDEIEETVKQQLLPLVGKGDVSQILAVRNKFMKEFHEKYPSPGKRPGCVIHNLEEMISNPINNS